MYKLKILLSFVLLLFFFASAVLFSDSRIDAIKKRYEEATQLKNSNNGYYHEVVCNSDGREIGPQSTTITMIYKSYEVQSNGVDENGKPRSNYPIQVRELYKATGTYAFGVKGKFVTDSEYLFNEQGELIFIYNRPFSDPGPENLEEMRFYLQKGKLIQVIKSRGGKVVYTDTDSFKEQYQKFTTQALINAEKYKTLFVTLNSVENIKFYE